MGVSSLDGLEQLYRSSIMACKQVPCKVKNREVSLEEDKLTQATHLLVDESNALKATTRPQTTDHNNS